MMYLSNNQVVRTFFQRQNFPRGGFFVFLALGRVTMGYGSVFAVPSPVHHLKSLPGGPWWVSRGFQVIFAPKKVGGGLFGAIFGKIWFPLKKDIETHVHLVCTSWNHCQVSGLPNAPNYDFPAPAPASCLPPKYSPWDMNSNRVDIK